MNENEVRKRCASSIASASAAISRVRLSSPVKRIELGELQQLLLARMPFVDRAHHTMRARRLAVGASEPAAGFLDPDQRRRCGEPHAVLDLVGNAVALVGGR